MKVVLQNKLSRFYFGNDGRWTADHSKARDFGTSLKAMDFLQANKVEQAQVVLKFQDTKYDIVLQALSDSPERKSPL
jgi:hypothetical protein